MWYNKISITLFSLLMSGVINAQDKLTLPEIPESLKENAYSVVRQNEQEFTYQSNVSGVQKNTSVITVLDSKGNNAANFVCPCDMFCELRKFHGNIYDAKGNLIRKIKQSDLKFTEYSSELASDDKYYYYECAVPIYPFTVKYEWETKHKKGLIGIPMFAPQSDYNQSIEKATYRFYSPQNADFIYKAVNMKAQPEKKTGEEGSYQEWTLTNLTAIEDEPFAESLSTLIPKLYIVPKNFTYDNTHGDMSNWNTFGNWQYSLLKDRDVLSEASKQKLAELTKECRSDREKVKAVYDYLAKTTRYVSIQLGIGGLQPMSAEEVAKAGFSDCKGLSNYMRAMLKEVGIPSTYTVISTYNPRLIKDFASANQMNHVILQVTLPEETLWLECTNPKLPFGFVHSDIAGHDALLIKETGGEICQLPTYKDSLSKESHTATISLTEQGNATANVTRVSHLFQYEAAQEFTELSPNKQIDYLREKILLPQAKVNNISFTENKSASPSIAIHYNVECERYGSKTGNRLFVPINVFRRGLPKLTTKNRIHSIYIKTGFMDNDTIVLEAPKNYLVESLPKPIAIEKTFGKFYSTINLDGDKILIINQLLLHSGKYDIKLYPEFTAFCKDVSNAYSSNVILKKKSE